MRKAPLFSADAVRHDSAVRHELRLHGPTSAPATAPPRARSDLSLPQRPTTIGVISNPKSHGGRNQKNFPVSVDAQVIFAAPGTKTALETTLIDFAARKVDILVVDGGDGTVRDVLTAARKTFGGSLPKFAILPAGKTNALALDLGIPDNWSVSAMLNALRDGHVKTRTPMEISRTGSSQPDLVGFLLGAGAFVQATALAQRTHAVGAFKGVAVGMSLAWSIAQTFFGAATNVWRTGERMRISGDNVVERSFYIVMATALEHLPLGLKPFGRVRPGMKVLAIDAPPRRMATNVPMLLGGSEAQRLTDAGYHRGDPESFDLWLPGDFILDGERYPGGDLTIRRGAPLTFIVP